MGGGQSGSPAAGGANRSGHQPATLKTPPTPERVRLGRWLFYDTRLSADGTVSCATCHEPEHAFSQADAGGHWHSRPEGQAQGAHLHQPGGDALPALLLGRARRLARGSGARPDGQSHRDGQHARGDGRHDCRRARIPHVFRARRSAPTPITKERIAQAIADYERTRMSGNSPYDRWRRTRDATAVSAEVKLGHELFFGKAGCVQCHVGSRFTDNNFHNIGIGWDAKTKTFTDEGRLPDDQGHDQRGLRRVRSRRVQDADAARGQQARALHARRLGGHAARGGGVLQPRRQQEPVPRSEDAGEAARPDAGRRSMRWWR